jgi:hypothetical protein
VPPSHSNAAGGFPGTPPASRDGEAPSRAHDAPAAGPPPPEPCGPDPATWAAAYLSGRTMLRIALVADVGVKAVRDALVAAGVVIRSGGGKKGGGVWRPYKPPARRRKPPAKP